MGIELYRVDDEVSSKSPVSAKALATALALELLLLENGGNLQMIIRFHFNNDHN